MTTTAEATTQQIGLDTMKLSRMVWRQTHLSKYTRLTPSKHVTDGNSYKAKIRTNDRSQRVIVKRRFFVTVKRRFFVTVKHRFFVTIKRSFSLLKAMTVQQYRPVDEDAGSVDGA